MELWRYFHKVEEFEALVGILQDFALKIGMPISVTQVTETLKKQGIQTRDDFVDLIDRRAEEIAGDEEDDDLDFLEKLGKAAGIKPDLIQ